MKEYHKIQSVFKRDEKTHKFIEGDYSLLEFEYLADNIWVWTEKVDGTNIRVMWDGENVAFGGKTDNAQMPPFLLAKLKELFPAEKFTGVFPGMCLYGEGYGAKIQKGGGNYIKDGCDFIMFDIKVGEWWLRRPDIEDVAGKLGIKVVPIINKGPLAQAINFVREGHFSTFGPFLAEGLVLKPEVELFTRQGHRIVTKIKHKDF